MEQATAVGERPRRGLARINLVDLAVGAFLLFLVPVAFGTFLLFRPPRTRIESVTSVPITREERRLAGGSHVSAKLKVRGSGLRPMLRATLDESPAIGFVFETPNSADVIAGPIAPGTHDLVLWDGVQEVARAPKSVTIQALPPPRVRAVGTILDLDRAAADGLREGARFPETGDAIAEIVRLGAAEPARRRMTDAAGGSIDAPVAGRWERRAVVLLRCDPESAEGECAVSGTPMTAGSAGSRGRFDSAVSALAVTFPWLQPLRLAVDEILPAAAPQPAVVRVRLTGTPDVLALVAVGDRDLLLDERAATVSALGPRQGDALTVTLAAGADPSRDGWRYRGRLLLPGAPLSFATGRYVVNGTVLALTGVDGGK
jgi:hypothetical protein